MLIKIPSLQKENIIQIHRDERIFYIFKITFARHYVRTYIVQNYICLYMKKFTW